MKRYTEKQFHSKKKCEQNKTQVTGNPWYIINFNLSHQNSTIIAISSGEKLFLTADIRLKLHNNIISIQILISVANFHLKSYSPVHSTYEYIAKN